MMETTKLSLAEQLKQEFMERYGLEANQIKLEIGIYTDDVELGRQILKDNDNYSTTNTTYLPETQICDNSYGEHINSLWVFKRKNKDAWDDSNES